MLVLLGTKTKNATTAEKSASLHLEKRADFFFAKITTVNDECFQFVSVRFEISSKFACRRKHS